MPAIKRTIPATTDDALLGLNFKVQPRPFLASLWSATDDEGDTITYGVDGRNVLVNAEPNLETASGTVDTSKDQILFREPMPAGEQFLAAVVTTDTHYLLNIEQL